MSASVRPTGSGPGVQTRDGCSVELYRQLQAGNEPDIVASVVADQGSILELGAGAGRVTHPLIARGYKVTAVDNSADMLGCIQGARIVLADIETLDLGQLFDAVMLGSHFINVPDERQRAALLATCRRHVTEEGAVLIERHDPDRFTAVRPGPFGEAGDVRHFIDALRIEGNLVHAILRSVTDASVWTQSFSTEILDDRQTVAALEAAGLRWVRWLDARKKWLHARVA